jgi:hypothetical protein
MLKLMMGLLTLALLVATMRRMMDSLRRKPVPVRTSRGPVTRPAHIARLRQDPKTGVYYPEG